MIKRYIKRDLYFNRIKPYINKNLIKVIVGQRRVGKSYFLYQLMDELISLGMKKSEIVYIDKESLDFDKISNYKDLGTYIKNIEKKNKVKAIFIDEIQEIENFQKTLRHWQSKNSYDIYCTGSNANILSGEIATILSGRYVEIEIFSLSYKEFLLFHKLEDIDDTLLSYIKYGGLPYLTNLKLEDDIAYDYLRNIYNTIILKDVVSRFNIRNVMFLEKLIQFLADNTGSLVSAKKISDYLLSQNTKMSTNVVLNYLSYLSSAFLIFRVQRIDIKGKKIFEINDKHYFEDLGLRHSVIRYSQVDISKVLENLVYMHLRVSGYRVFVGQLGKKEVDFVAEKNGKTIYIQVAYLILDEKTKEREFGNLLAINDNHKKIVVTMDKMIKGGYKGIEHISIREFLSTYL
ncbi:MAG: ATP-binding protein [Patescibacteria group bacterium]|jgi:predicted AAA+ superfamily ATPase|nr:ATP-binding protein [Patescibacteria group bacterium]